MREQGPGEGSYMMPPSLHLIAREVPVARNKSGKFGYTKFLNIILHATVKLEHVRAFGDGARNGVSRPNGVIERVHSTCRQSRM